MEIRGLNLPNYLSKAQKAQIKHAIKEDIPIIISGKQGPTGKTTLKQFLVSNGITAYEEWECQMIVLNKYLS